MQSIGLAAAAAATAATATAAATVAVGGSGSLQSQFKAQTVHLRDIQCTQRPKNIQQAYKLRQKE